MARRLRQADNRRLEFVRSLFRAFCADEDVEVRAMLAYSAVIGSYFVAADHGDRTRAQVLRLAVEPAAPMIPADLARPYWTTENRRRGHP